MSEEWSQYVSGLFGSLTVQYVVTFVVIFSLLSALVVTMRRRRARREEPEMRPGQRGRKARLGIVDVYEMDADRRLILLRRDNVEHLLLVGGPNDVVIERHIERGASARPDPRAEFPEAGPGGSRGESASQRTRTDPTLPSYLPAPSRTAPEPAPLVIPPPGVDLTKRDPDKPDDAPSVEGKAERDALSDMAEQIEAALALAPEVPEPGRKAIGDPKPPGTLDLFGVDTHAPSEAKPASEEGTSSVDHAPGETLPAQRSPSPDAGTQAGFPKPLANIKPGRPNNSTDIFSIQEIEAEFARLLGRQAGGPPK